MSSFHKKDPAGAANWHSELCYVFQSLWYKDFSKINEHALCVFSHSGDLMISACQWWAGNRIEVATYEYN